MLTTYQVERFADIADELPPLWVKHWRVLGMEQGRVKLDPDVVQYLALEVAGILHVVTARRAGALIGYFFNLLPPQDLHYKGHKRAWADIYFVDPEASPGLSLGVKLLKLALFTRDRLRALGVQEHRTSVKLHSDIGLLWQRLGYRPVETVYYDMLEG